MFNKPRKVFPPGTFLPAPQRVLAIFQLCLAFIAICVYAGHPFMGALFNQKAQLSLFENVMGTLPEPLTEQDRTQQQFNNNQFSQLSVGEKTAILAKYHQIQQIGNSSFLAKCQEACVLLIFKTPPFTKAWIFFSILLSILMLRKREGAAQAAWVLPILACAFAWDSYQNLDKQAISPEAKLFPSEQVVMRDYLKEPLSSSILEQHQQLKKGWNQYLIIEWAREIPSPFSTTHNLQVFKGEFAFNLARLKLQIQHPSSNSSFLAGAVYNPLLIYLLYFWWNLFFAWFMNRNRWKPNKVPV